MQRLVKMGHMPVAAIDGQRVLDQVIGPDAEKINLFSQDVRGNHC
jgi:hypothetical protein